MSPVETLLADVAREHRRNEVDEPGHGHLPIFWRVKCESNACEFYAERPTWFEVCAAHEAHLAAEQAKALQEALAAMRTHNGTPVTPENLRWAATHEALCRSWIFDALTGVADLIGGTP